MAAVVGCFITTSCTHVAGWFGTNTDSTKNQAADSSSYAAWSRDESITPANSYSDLFLDSTTVENYIQKEKLDKSVADGLRNFYLSRNYQYAWFTSGGMTEQAKGFWNVYTQDSVKSDKHLRQHVDSLIENDSLAINKNDSSFIPTELALTKNLVQFAKSHTEGAITSSNVYYLVPVKKQDPLQMADSVLHNEKDSLQNSSNKAYALLKQQLNIYYKAVKDSSWKTLNIRPEKLLKGSTAPAVMEIKKRLQATGDYAASDTTRLFNDSLVAAIKDYQQRNGLMPTGIVNDSLITNLNVPAEQRVEQILVNMNRMLWMQPMQDSSRIVVNIPSLMLCAYSDSGKVFQMPVIVGKEGTSTMMFKGSINQIVFNPIWHIPQSIVKNDILPKMKTDPLFLKKNNMEIVSRKDSIPEVSQLPGKNNALGDVKFVFPNSYDIYLHDTPDKTLFAKKDRALSHGCIRVADAQKLSAYLLRNQNEWSLQKIELAIKSDKEQTVMVKDVVPVYITYNTAWVDENGKLNFRNDIYGHDKETIERMFKNQE